tara:strand:- start:1331 stop:2905 length:1575 start_codon:yes stop_codon:yes gene_type:complete
MTTYYADADNGQSSFDGSAATWNMDPSSTVGPWADLDAFTEASRSAGDKLILRRGMTGHYGTSSASHLDFTSDGDFNNPIIIEADYDDVWSDFQTESSVTLTAGSKTVTLATGSVATAGDWIYNSGDSDDPRKFAYELESVTPDMGGGADAGTLYLPFKGTAGSSKTITIMPAAPVWGDGSSWDKKIQSTTDLYWVVRGVKVFTSQSRAWQLNNVTGWQIEDCIIEANGTGLEGFKGVGGACDVVLRKCRLKNEKYGIVGTTGSAAGSLNFYLYDCLIDGNSQANSAGLFPKMSSDFHCVDCEFKGHATGDIAYQLDSGTPYPEHRGRVWLRNCKLSSTTEIDHHQDSPNGRIYSEDHDQAVSDTRFFSMLSSAEGTPALQSDTGTVRSGGSNTSIKVTPSDNMGTVYDLSLLRLFELPFYATADSKTYTVYFRPTATADWTADPTAAQLWIELEYRSHATNKPRVIKKSTGTIDMNGSTSWQSLAVTAQPGQVGVVYLRGWYGKTKESGKANTFYIDPVPEVS